jgi:hypothetical protein
MSVSIDTINQTSLVPQSLNGIDTTGRYETSLNTTNGLTLIDNLASQTFNFNSNGVLTATNSNFVFRANDSGGTTQTQVQLSNLSNDILFQGNLNYNSMSSTTQFTSSLGSYDSGANTSTWTITIPNNLGSSFDYRAVIQENPITIDFTTEGEELALQNQSGEIGYWGVSAGVAIYVPYTIGGVAGNGGYVFSSYSHPAFPQLTGLVTNATTTITGENTYTTTLQGDWSNQTFVISVIQRI